MMVQIVHEVISLEGMVHTRKSYDAKMRKLRIMQEYLNAYGQTQNWSLAPQAISPFLRRLSVSFTCFQNKW